MKIHKLIIASSILTAFLCTSCIVKHDNGKHKGWFKVKSSNSNKSAGKSGNPGKGHKK